MYSTAQSELLQVGDVIVEVDNQGAIILLVPVVECSLSFENSFLTLVLVLALVVVVVLLLLLHTQNSHFRCERGRGAAAIY